MEKVLEIKNIRKRTSDFEFWSQKSPQDRLRAIEYLRNQYIISQEDAQPGLQRVYKVIKPK